MAPVLGDDVYAAVAVTPMTIIIRRRGKECVWDTGKVWRRAKCHKRAQTANCCHVSNQALCGHGQRLALRQHLGSPTDDYLGGVEDEVAYGAVRDAFGGGTGRFGGEKDGLLRSRWSMHA